MKPYHVDLKSLQRDGEVIYHLLIRLLGEMKATSSKSIYLGGNDDDHCLLLTVTETTPYTALVDISPLNTQGWAAGFSMQLRAYHDADIAEVIQCEGLSKLLPKYSYPNRKMLQPDEKEQLNKFVREWLEHCYRFGRSADVAWPWETK